MKGFLQKNLLILHNFGIAETLRATCRALNWAIDGRGGLRCIRSKMSQIQLLRVCSFFHMPKSTEIRASQVEPSNYSATPVQETQKSIGNKDIFLTPEAPMENAYQQRDVNNWQD